MLINRRGQLGVWLFFAFLFLLIGIFLLFIFLHGREPVKPVPLNFSNTTYFNVSIVLLNISGSLPVSYVLSNISFVSHGGYNGSLCDNVTPFLSSGFVFNGSDDMGCPLVGKWVRGAVLVHGLFFVGRPEFFSQGVVENSTVLLEGFSDSYYFNSTVCNISRNNFPCSLSLNKKASDYSLNFSNGLLLINISNGVLQKPMICVAYPYLVSNVIISGLNRSVVPTDIVWKYDFCWNVSRDLSSSSNFSFVVHKNFLFNDRVALPLGFFVRDWEVDGKQNIGDRSIFRNISFPNNVSYVLS